MILTGTHASARERLVASFLPHPLEDTIPTALLSSLMCGYTSLMSYLPLLSFGELSVVAS